MPRPVVMLLLAALAALAFGVAMSDEAAFMLVPALLLLGGAVVYWFAPGDFSAWLRQLHATKVKFALPRASQPPMPPRHIAAISPQTQSKPALQSAFKAGDSDDVILSALYALTPAAFEHFAAGLLARMGYADVRVMGKSGDNGVDITMRNGAGELCVAQCKRYRNSVSPAIVRELLGVMTREQAAEGFLITTGKVSSHAEAWAGAHQIKVIDAPRLVYQARRYV